MNHGDLVSAEHLERLLHGTSRRMVEDERRNQPLPLLRGQDLERSSTSASIAVQTREQRLERRGSAFRKIALVVDPPFPQVFTKQVEW